MRKQDRVILRPEHMVDARGLIPLDEVSRRLGLNGQSYAGIRAIQI